MNNDINENKALSQTSVSGSTYAIYYDYFGTKMWLSPNNSNFPKEEDDKPYTCVSHPFRRYTFTEKELTEKILELTKEHPTNTWLYEVVE